MSDLIKDLGGAAALLLESGKLEAGSRVLDAVVEITRLRDENAKMQAAADAEAEREFAPLGEW